MGFRCPKCHKDFGVDKKSMEEHIYHYASISLDDLMESIDANTEDVTKVIVLHSTLADTRDEE